VLELRAGSVITGNVVAVSGGSDALRLGGSGNASFDVGSIGIQYQNFASFEKTGSGIWTLTGSSAALTPWTISGGTLAISQDASLGDPSGGLVLHGGTLGFHGGPLPTPGTTLPGRGA